MAWLKAGNVTDFPVDEACSASIEGKMLAIFNVDGALYATDPICTHAFAMLIDGYFEGDEIECPLHQGRFNVRTGKALCAPLKEDLRCYEVRVDGADVMVNI